MRPYILRKGVSRLEDLANGRQFIHGDAFYVNTAAKGGNDTNSGTEVDEPLLTLTKAISQCEDDKDDYIFVMDYWRPTGETWPISVNKNGIHIIGVARPGPLPYPAIHPSTDVAALQLTSAGQYVEIAGLTLGGGAAHGGIDWMNEGQVDGAWIHDCTFGHQWFGTPLSGIHQVATASRGGYGNLIERCTFMGDLANCTGAITGNAIDMLGSVASYDLQVVNCIFKGCYIGINCTVVHNGVYLDNRFVCADAVDGEAISLLTACRGNMADGNRAMNGGDAAMTQEPYRDVAATNNNHWGVNYTTDAVDLPKQT